jgi:RNA polymerase-associated protein CTR9
VRQLLQATLQYNYARAQECAGNIEQAARLLRAVIRVYPHLLDAHLRLALLERGRGRSDQAARYVEGAIALAPRAVEPQLVGALLMRDRGDLRSARRIYTKVLQEVDKFDLVSLLHLGNSFLIDWRPTKEVASDPAALKDERAKALMEAQRLFDKVLQLDPRNPYAANALAIALREKGWVRDALRAMEHVREAAPAVPCFTINYAHMLCEVGEFRRAVRLVRSVASPSSLPPALFPFPKHTHKLHAHARSRTHTRILNLFTKRKKKEQKNKIKIDTMKEERKKEKTLQGNGLGRDVSLV